jgi:hypothetical protein
MLGELESLRGKATFMGGMREFEIWSERWRTEELEPFLEVLEKASHKEVFTYIWSDETNGQERYKQKFAFIGSVPGDDNYVDSRMGLLSNMFSSIINNDTESFNVNYEILNKELSEELSVLVIQLVCYHAIKRKSVGIIVECLARQSSLNYETVEGKTLEHLLIEFEDREALIYSARTTILTELYGESLALIFRLICYQAIKDKGRGIIVELMPAAIIGGEPQILYAAYSAKFPGYEISQDYIKNLLDAINNNDDDLFKTSMLLLPHDDPFDREVLEASFYRASHSNEFKNAIMSACLGLGLQLESECLDGRKVWQYVLSSKIYSCFPDVVRSAVNSEGLEMALACIGVDIEADIEAGIEEASLWQVTRDKLLEENTSFFMKSLFNCIENEELTQIVSYLNLGVSLGNEAEFNNSLKSRIVPITLLYNSILNNYTTAFRRVLEIYCDAQLTTEQEQSLKNMFVAIDGEDMGLFSQSYNQLKPFDQHLNGTLLKSVILFALNREYRILVEKCIILVEESIILNSSDQVIQDICDILFGIAMEGDQNSVLSLWFNVMAKRCLVSSKLDKKFLIPYLQQIKDYSIFNESLMDESVYSMLSYTAVKEKEVAVLCNLLAAKLGRNLNFIVGIYLEQLISYISTNYGKGFNEYIKWMYDGLRNDSQANNLLEVILLYAIKSDKPKIVYYCLQRVDIASINKEKYENLRSKEATALSKLITTAHEVFQSAADSNNRLINKLLYFVLSNNLERFESWYQQQVLLENLSDGEVERFLSDVLGYAVDSQKPAIVVACLEQGVNLDLNHNEKALIELLKESPNVCKEALDLAIEKRQLISIFRLVSELSIEVSSIPTLSSGLQALINLANQSNKRQVVFVDDDYTLLFSALVSLQLGNGDINKHLQNLRGKRPEAADALDQIITEHSNGRNFNWPANVAGAHLAAKKAPERPMTPDPEDDKSLWLR